MSGADRIDETWNEQGLGACSTEVLLGTLRHHGVTLDEERLARAAGVAEALALAASWMRDWKGPGLSAAILPVAVLELWRRLTATRPREGVGATGLPRAFHECFMFAPLDTRLALAREVAADPRFEAEDALALGRGLRGVLRDAGRGAEFEGVLASWEARVPQVYRAEPALLGWRVECALERPGADVHGALMGLAAWRGHLVPLLKLAEWCLYRGHVHAALAGLTAAWPGVRDSTRLFGWDVEDFAQRAVFTTLDAVLSREPAPGEPGLLERLAPFGPLAAGWLDRALAYRAGEWSWQGTLELWPQLTPEQFLFEQQALVMAFERQLRAHHGWPLGRTQLLHPWMLVLLPDMPRKAREVEKVAREPSTLLLPPEWVLHEWARPNSDSRYRHPHAEAAVAAALLPWGHFLRQLGLLNERVHALWRIRVTRALAKLPEQFSFADDPALASEVRQSLRGG
ncbi:hypothetical protein [Hyalangium rubrum]|uniref:Uncharacterized protein n=1 Tax=Hyalangium rubrum TaxID=3103134 RepID=A0ABU5HBQ3_9BACT|nr:hypothetical protein [Hyalangium sp. s54d21]MDY7230263.1 hypothetical protein [Hyalangium sp. s54d21]